LTLFGLADVVEAADEVDFTDGGPRFSRNRRREGGRDGLDLMVVAGELVAEEVLLVSFVDEAVVKEVDELLRCILR
jgi:hypothetical protein